MTRQDAEELRDYVNVLLPKRKGVDIVSEGFPGSEYGWAYVVVTFAQIRVFIDSDTIRVHQLGGTTTPAVYVTHSEGASVPPFRSIMTHEPLVDMIQTAIGVFITEVNTL